MFGQNGGEDVDYSYSGYLASKTMSLELASPKTGMKYQRLESFQTLIKCPWGRQQGLPLPLRHIATAGAQAGVKSSFVLGAAWVRPYILMMAAYWFPATLIYAQEVLINSNRELVELF